MLLSDLLEEVEPRWHQAFIRFIERGEAEEDFLTYLDSSEACQRAVERVFRDQAANVERLVQAIHGAPEWNAAAASASIIDAIEKVAVTLPDEERAAAFQKAADVLERERERAVAHAGAAGAGRQAAGRHTW